MLIMSRGLAMNFADVSLELGYLVKEVQQDLRKRMDKSLSSLDLTTPQYSVLAELKQFPGLTSAELARKSFVTPQTMSLIVQKLEERGLVARTDSATNGKVLNTELTPDGLKLLGEAH
jgi:DNA-binding MarR family transcriptional regulator